MLKKSENFDVNYLAEVVSCPVLEVHPNADKLQTVSIFGGKVVVGKGAYTQGERLVYFPIESCLSSKFLSWANLLSKPELNADGVSKGFFETKGRVKAVKLRDIPSEGFLYPVAKLAEYFNVSPDIFKVGLAFDTVGEEILVKKYIAGERQAAGEARVKKPTIPTWLTNAVDWLPRPVRKPINQFLYRAYKKPDGIKELIKEGQFRLHYDTEHLGRNSHMVNPDDVITITDKLHGTSAVYSNILAKPVIPWWMKPFVSGKDVYTFVYTSRNTYKNRRDGKFTDDVWGHWAGIMKAKVEASISIYGEIVGFNPNSAKYIQKNYDYGHPVGESGFYVYRITITDDKGDMQEFTWEQIEEYCKANDLTTVPVYYHGIAKDMFPTLDHGNVSWNTEFLEELRKTYLEKDCKLCKSKVPSEGVVLKNNTHEHRPVFKFKSSRFNLKEAKDRDEGEVDMEELA